jgi:large subunit ribosomal protein L22
MKVSAKLKNLRISPRKVRLIAGLIKGLDVNEAAVQLENTVKRSSLPVEKLLRSVIANAENNLGLDKDNLYVYDIQVGEGIKYKRWLPRAFGRATPILKRTSNIFVTLEERVEGKGRKSKEEMEKEKKKRKEEKKKLEKEMQAEREKLAKVKPGLEQKMEGKEEIPFREKRVDEEQKRGEKKGWIKKMFQRKSG